MQKVHSGGQTHALGRGSNVDLVGIVPPIQALQEHTMVDGSSILCDKISFHHGFLWVVDFEYAY